MIHSIGSRPSLAGLDGAFSCFVGFSGYLSSGVGLLCWAAPGNTNEPNPRHNAKIRMQARASRRAPATTAIAPALIKSRRAVIFPHREAQSKFEEIHDCLLSIHHVVTDSASGVSCWFTVVSHSIQKQPAPICTKGVPRAKKIQSGNPWESQKNLAAPQGFEPRYADPESAVLPLNEGAASSQEAESLPLDFRGWAGCGQPNLPQAFYLSVRAKIISAHQ